MWKVTTLLCVLIGATPLFGFIDSQHASGFIGAFAAILLCVAMITVPTGELTFLRSVSIPYLIAAAIPLAWMVVQLLPMTSFAHPAWQTAAENLGSPVTGRISIDPEATLEALLNYLTACSVAIASAAVAIDRRRARRVTAVLAATALVTMIVSILRLHLSQPLPPSLVELRSGTAICTVVGVSICIAAAIETWEVSRSQSRNDRRSVETWYFIAGAVVIACLGWLAGGGPLAISTVAPISSILFVWACRRLGASPRAGAIVGAALLAIGAGTAIASNHDRTIFTVIAFSAASSDDAAATQAMLGDVTFSGIGAGASASMLQTYTNLQDASVNEVPATAAAAAYAGLGPILFWITIAALAVLLIVLTAAAIKRGRDWSFCAATMGAIVGLMTMAFRLPFALSTPTVLLFATLLGAGIAQSVARSRPSVI